MYSIRKILLITGFILLHLFYLEGKNYPKPSEINKRINYLQRVIEQPLDNNSDIVKLGKENKEWILFSYAFSTYALTNIAIKDSTYKERAVKIIKTAIQRATEESIYGSFGVRKLLLLDSIPKFSVLYLGHLNLMLGCYRRLSNDTSFNKLNDKISISLVRRYSSIKFLNLESYRSSIWIPDNTVALASLKLHSFNTGSQYDTICKKWVDYARKNYIDKRTGVLYSTVDPNTGEADEEPRGSMLGWSIMFIYQFDPDFSVELYKNYKKHFSKNYIVFRLFRERYKNKRTDLGDIDSGPLFRGFSIPANEFALSNAVIANDKKTARRLKRLINTGTKRITKDNEYRYKVRFVNLNVSPMAEALVLFSLTMVNWTK